MIGWPLPCTTALGFWSGRVLATGYRHGASAVKNVFPFSQTPDNGPFFAFSYTPPAAPHVRHRVSLSERTHGLSESSRTSSMGDGADILPALPPVTLFPSLRHYLRPPLRPSQSPLLAYKSPLKLLASFFIHH